MSNEITRTLREEARLAKNRVKSGFWSKCQQDFSVKKEKARAHGINESKASRYFKSKVEAEIEGRQEDEFYLKVKEILLLEGEVSDAIGRLTDHEYYATLSYEERQRYNLSLSERYLRALERFRYEYEFELLENES